MSGQKLIYQDVARYFILADEQTLRNTFPKLVNDENIEIIKKQLGDKYTKGDIRIALSYAYYYNKPITKAVEDRRFNDDTKQVIFEDLNKNLRVDTPFDFPPYWYGYSSKGKLGEITILANDRFTKEGYDIDREKSSIRNKSSVYIDKIFKPALEKVKQEYDELYKEGKIDISKSQYIAENLYKAENKFVIDYFNNLNRIEKEESEQYGELLDRSSEIQNIISTAPTTLSVKPSFAERITEKLVNAAIPIPISIALTSDLRDYPYYTHRLAENVDRIAEEGKIKETFGHLFPNKEITEIDVRDKIRNDELDDLVGDFTAISLGLIASRGILNATKLPNLLKKVKFIDKLEKVAAKSDDLSLTLKNYKTLLKTKDYWSTKLANITVGGINMYIPSLMLTIKTEDKEDLLRAWRDGEYGDVIKQLAFDYVVSPFFEGASEGVIYEKVVPMKANAFTKIFKNTIGAGTREAITEQLTDILSDIKDGTKTNVISWAITKLGKGYTEEFNKEFSETFERRYKRLPTEEELKRAYEVFHNVSINYFLAEFLSGAITGGFFATSRSIANNVRLNAFKKDYKDIIKLLVESAPHTIVKMSLDQTQSLFTGNLESIVSDTNEKNTELTTNELTYGMADVNRLKNIDIEETDPEKANVIRNAIQQTIDELEKFDSENKLEDIKTFKDYLEYRMRRGSVVIKTMLKALNKTDESTYYENYLRKNPLKSADGIEGRAEKLYKKLKSNVISGIDTLQLGGKLPLSYETEKNGEKVEVDTIDELMLNAVTGDMTEQIVNITLVFEEIKDKIEMTDKTTDKAITNEVIGEVYNILKMNLMFFNNRDEFLDEFKKPGDTQAENTQLNYIKEMIKLSYDTLSVLSSEIQNLSYIDDLVKMKKEKHTKADIEQLEELYKEIDKSIEDGKLGRGKWYWEMLESLEKLIESPIEEHKLLVLGLLIKHAEAISSVFGKEKISKVEEKLKKEYIKQLKGKYKARYIYYDKYEQADMINKIIEMLKEDLGVGEGKLIEEINTEQLKEDLLKANYDGIYSLIKKHIKVKESAGKAILFDIIYHYFLPLLKKKLDIAESKKEKTTDSKESKKNVLDSKEYSERNIDELREKILAIKNDKDVENIIEDILEYLQKVNFIEDKTFLTIYSLFYLIKYLKNKGKIEHIKHIAEEYVREPVGTINQDRDNKYEKIDEILNEKGEKELTKTKAEIIQAYLDNLNEKVTSEILKAFNDLFDITLNDEQKSNIEDIINNEVSLEAAIENYKLSYTISKYIYNLANDNDTDIKKIEKYIISNLEKKKITKAVNVLSYNFINGEIAYENINQEKSSDALISSVIAYNVTINFGLEEEIDDYIAKNYDSIVEKALEEETTEESTEESQKVKRDGYKVKLMDSMNNIKPVNQSIDDLIEETKEVLSLYKEKSEQTTPKEIIERYNAYKRFIEEIIDKGLLEATKIPQEIYDLIKNKNLFDNMLYVIKNRIKGLSSIDDILNEVKNVIKDEAYKDFDLTEDLQDKLAKYISNLIKIQVLYAPYDIVFGNEIIEDKNLASALNGINIFVSRLIRGTVAYENFDVIGKFKYAFNFENSDDVIARLEEELKNVENEDLLIKLISNITDNVTGNEALAKSINYKSVEQFSDEVISVIDNRISEIKNLNEKKESKEEGKEETEQENKEEVEEVKQKSLLETIQEKFFENEKIDDNSIKIIKFVEKLANDLGYTINVNIYKRKGANVKIDKKEKVITITLSSNLSFTKYKFFGEIITATKAGILQHELLHIVDSLLNGLFNNQEFVKANKSSELKEIQEEIKSIEKQLGYSNTTVVSEKEIVYLKDPNKLAEKDRELVEKLYFLRNKEKQLKNDKQTNALIEEYNSILSIKQQINEDIKTLNEVLSDIISVSIIKKDGKQSINSKEELIKGFEKLKEKHKNSKKLFDYLISLIEGKSKEGSESTFNKFQQLIFTLDNLITSSAKDKDLKENQSELITSEIFALLNPYDEYAMPLILVSSLIEKGNNSLFANFIKKFNELISKIISLINKYFDVNLDIKIENSYYAAISSNIQRIIESIQSDNNPNIITINSAPEIKLESTEQITESKEIEDELEINIISDNEETTPDTDELNPNEDNEDKLNYPNFDDYQLEEDYLSIDKEFYTQEEYSFPKFVNDYQAVTLGDTKRIIEYMLQVRFRSNEKEYTLEEIIDRLTFEEFYDLLNPLKLFKSNKEINDIIKNEIEYANVKVDDKAFGDIFSMKALSALLLDKAKIAITKTAEYIKLKDSNKNLSKKDLITLLNNHINSKLLEYYKREVRNRYNLLKSAKKQKVIRVYKTNVEGKTVFSHKLMGEEYKGVNGNLLSSRMNDPQITNLIPSLLNYLRLNGIKVGKGDITVVFLDSIVDLDTNQGSKDLSDLFISPREFSEYMLDEGYVYINKQGDKDTVLLLNIDQKVLKSISDNLFEKFLRMKVSYGELFYKNTNNEDVLVDRAMLAKALEVIKSNKKTNNPDLLNLINAIDSIKKDKMLPIYIVTSLINEFKYGNTSANLNSEKYLLAKTDGKKIMKYGVLSSPITHNEITKDIINSLNQKGLLATSNNLKAPFVYRNGKLYVRAIVINDRELLNKLGKPRTDGTLIGDSDKIGWLLREIYGSNNFGNIKPYYYDANEGLYLKALLSLYHNNPITDLMASKGIGLIITATSDKFNRLSSKAINYNEFKTKTNLEENIIEIDVTNINRSFETGKTTDEILGFAQLLHSTQIVESAKSLFKDISGLNLIVDKSIQKLNNLHKHKKELLKNVLLRIQKEPNTINEILFKKYLDKKYKDKLKDTDADVIYNDTILISKNNIFRNVLLNYINNYIRTTVKYSNEGTTFTLTPDLGYDIHSKSITINWVNTLFEKYKEDTSFKSRVNSAFNIKGEIKSAEQLHSLIFDENGYIHRDFCIISKKEALLNNIKIGDRIINYILPLDTADGAKTVIVAGISDNLSETTAIVNSEYIQLLGKDYDADVIYSIIQGGYTNEQWEKITDVFWHLDQRFINQLYKELIDNKKKLEKTKELRKYVYKNQGQSDESKIIENIPNENYLEQAKIVFDPDIAIAYCIIKLGFKTGITAKDRINKTDYEFFQLGYDYSKTIGKIIQLRELFTFFLATNTKVYDINDNLIFDGKQGVSLLSTANLLFKYTSNHAVDYPNDNSKDYYVDNPENILAAVLGINILQAKDILKSIYNTKFNEMFNIPRFVDSILTDVKAKAFVERVIITKMLLNKFRYIENAKRFINTLNENLVNRQINNYFVIPNPEAYPLSRLVSKITVDGIIEELNNFLSNKPINVISSGYSKLEIEYLIEALYEDLSKVTVYKQWSIFTKSLEEKAGDTNSGLTPEFLQEIIDFIRHVYKNNLLTSITSTIDLIQQYDSYIKNKYKNNPDKLERLKSTNSGITYFKSYNEGKDLEKVNDRILLFRMLEPIIFNVYKSLSSKTIELIDNYLFGIESSPLQKEIWDRLTNIIENEKTETKKVKEIPITKSNALDLIFESLDYLPNNIKIKNKDINKLILKYVRDIVYADTKQSITITKDEQKKYEEYLNFIKEYESKVLNKLENINKNKKLKKKLEEKEAISKVFKGVLLPIVDNNILWDDLKKKIISSKDNLIVLNVGQLSNKLKLKLFKLIEEGVLYKLNVNGQDLYVNDKARELIEEKYLMLANLSKDLLILNRINKNKVIEYLKGNISIEALSDFKADEDNLLNKLILPDWFGGYYKYSPNSKYAYTIVFNNLKELEEQLELFLSGKIPTNRFNLDFNKLNTLIAKGIKNESLNSNIEKYLGLLGYKIENDKVVRKNKQAIKEFISDINKVRKLVRNVDTNQLINNLALKYSNQKEALSKAVFTTLISNLLFIKPALFGIVYPSKHPYKNELVKGKEHYFDFVEYLAHYFYAKEYSTEYLSGYSNVPIKYRLKLLPEYSRYIMDDNYGGYVKKANIDPLDLDYFRHSAMVIMRNAIISMNRFIDSKTSLYKYANITEKEFKTFISYYIDKIRFQNYLKSFLIYNLSYPKKKVDEYEITLTDGNSIIISNDEHLRLKVTKVIKNKSEVTKANVKLTVENVNELVESIDYTNTDNLEKLSKLVSAKGEDFDAAFIGRSDTFLNTEKVIELALKNNNKSMQLLEQIHTILKNKVDHINIGDTNSLEKLKEAVKKSLKELKIDEAELYDLLMTSLDSKSLRLLFKSMVMTQQFNTKKYRAGYINENIALLMHLMAKYTPDLFIEYVNRVKKITIDNSLPTDDLVSVEDKSYEVEEEFSFPVMNEQPDTVEQEPFSSQELITKIGQRATEILETFNHLSSEDIKNIKENKEPLDDEFRKAIKEVVEGNYEEGINKAIDLIFKKITSFVVYNFVTETEGDYTLLDSKEKLEQIAQYIEWHKYSFGDINSKEKIAVILTKIYAAYKKAEHLAKNKKLTPDEHFRNIAREILNPLMFVDDDSDSKHLVWLNINALWEKVDNKFVIKKGTIFFKPEEIYDYHSPILESTDFRDYITAFEVARYREFRTTLEKHKFVKKAENVIRSIKLITEKYSKTNAEKQKFYKSVLQAFKIISSTPMVIREIKEREGYYYNYDDKLYDNRDNFISKLSEKVRIEGKEVTEEYKKDIINVVLYVKELLTLIKDRALKASIIIDYLLENDYITDELNRNNLKKKSKKLSRLANALIRGKKSQKLYGDTYDYFPTMYNSNEFILSYSTDKEKIQSKIEYLEKNRDNLNTYELRVLQENNGDYRLTAIKLLRNEAKKVVGDNPYFIPALNYMFYEIDSAVSVTDISLVLNNLASGFLDLLNTVFDEVNYSLTVEALKSTNDYNETTMTLFKRYLRLGGENTSIHLKTIKTEDVVPGQKVSIMIEKEKLLNDNTIVTETQIIEGYFVKVENDEVYLSKNADLSYPIAYKGAFIYSNNRRLEANEHINVVDDFGSKGRFARAFDNAKSLLSRLILGYAGKYVTAIMQALGFILQVYLTSGLYGSKAYKLLFNSTLTDKIAEKLNIHGFFDRFNIFSYGLGKLKTVTLTDEEMKDLESLVAYVTSLGNSATFDAMVNKIVNIDENNIFEGVKSHKEIKSIIKHSKSHKLFSKYITLKRNKLNKLLNEEFDEEKLLLLNKLNYDYNIDVEQLEEEIGEDEDLKAILDVIKELISIKDELSDKRVGEYVSEQISKERIKSIKVEKSIGTTQILEAKLRGKLVALSYKIARQYGRTHQEALAHAASVMEAWHALYNSRAKLLTHTSALRRFIDTLYHYISTTHKTLKSFKKIEKKKYKFIFDVMEESEKLLEYMKNSDEPYVNPKGILRRLTLISAILYNIADYIPGVGNIIIPTYMVILDSIGILLKYMLYDDDEDRDVATRYELYRLLSSIVGLKRGLIATSGTTSLLNLFDKLYYETDISSKSNKQTISNAFFENILTGSGELLDDQLNLRMDVERNVNFLNNVIDVAFGSILNTRNIKLYMNLYDLADVDDIIWDEMGDSNYVKNLENIIASTTAIRLNLWNAKSMLDDEAGIFSLKFLISNPLVPYGKTLYIGFSENDGKSRRKIRQKDETTPIREIIRELTEPIVEDIKQKVN